MSTKTKKKLTLPKGLPKLPSVPDGYDAWEYMGIGKKEGIPNLSGFASIAYWPDKPTREWDIDLMGWLEGTLTDAHYCRAIKRPAPAKKKAAKNVGQLNEKEAEHFQRALQRGAKKQPKAKAVKAVSAYANTDLTEFSTDWAIISEGHNAPKCDPIPVKVIDISNPDALVEQAAAELGRLRSGPMSDWDLARAALNTLGIIPKRKGVK